MYWFVRHLIYLSLTKPTMQQYFHPSAKHLLYRYITLSCVGHSFRVKGETWYFFRQFTAVHFDIFLCHYAGRTLRMKLLIWCRVTSRARLGLRFVKIFRACIQNFFITFRVTIFFLPWRRFVVLTAVTSVSEVIMICLQLILFANTAAFFYSLLGLVSHSFWGGDSGEEIRTRWRCGENINHSRDSWLVLRSLQAGFSCV